LDAIKVTTITTASFLQQNSSQHSAGSSESSSDSDPKPSNKFMVNGEGIEVIQIQGDTGSLLSAVNLLSTSERSKEILLFLL